MFLRIFSFLTEIRLVSLFKNLKSSSFFVDLNSEVRAADQSPLIDSKFFQFEVYHYCSSGCPYERVST
jgi:hypothetical protein